MSRLDSVKTWARLVKRDVMAVYFVGRDPETPPPVRWLALGVAAYALSPIDLIPDFVPVVGYLDDLLIVPTGIWLVIRLVPPPVLAASRQKAEAILDRPRSWGAALCIVSLWLLLAALALFLFLRR